MKKNINLTLFILLIALNYVFSQNMKTFVFKYNYTGKQLSTAFSEENGIIYKSYSNICFKKSSNWYKYKNNETYFFSDQHKDSDSFTSIDFYIVNKHFISDKFY